MTISRRMAVGVLFAWAGVTPGMAGDGHGDDIVVGRDGSGGLAFEFGGEQPIPLFPIDGLLNGWAANEPGFMSLEADEPGEDFFTLGTSANIVLDIVAIDPALKLWTPGFGTVLDHAGDQFLLGTEFDVHLTFHIDSSDPLYDGSQTLWQATVQFIDTGATGYAVSEPLVLSFSPVPWPGAGVLLLWVVCAVRTRGWCTR
jgi:hypothetical protein